MKASKFDDKYPITVLRFLAQVKRACNYNEVLEGMNIFRDVQLYERPDRIDSDC